MILMILVEIELKLFEKMKKKLRILKKIINLRFETVS